MRRAFLFILGLVLFAVANSARAENAATLKVEVPEGTKVASAVAVASGIKVETAGAVSGRIITFEKLLADTPYNVRLTLADGAVIQGVDLNWYDEEEAKPDAGEIKEEDRAEIKQIIGLDPFYTKVEVLQLQGNHDRVAALVQYVRDKDFVEGAGQVIWRVELNYFKNQHGGWERVGQQNKIIRRERYKTHEAFAAGIAKIRFVPVLGGLKVAAAQSPRTVKVEKLDPAK
ncbi:MAG TPA: hypothetical protein VG269_25045 [Tepidisphaeraceae bacterium]|nr:hypothetical protein [Tepidisphaeraceae bacterium]